MSEFFANPVTLTAAVISASALAFGVYFIVFFPRLFMLGLKNLRRHLVRTALTGLATMVLVFVITVIWTIVFNLDQAMREKSKDLKLIITEKWQVPSLLPMTHANYLNPTSQYFLKELQGL